MTVIKVLISYILMVDICNKNEQIYETYKIQKKLEPIDLIVWL